MSTLENDEALVSFTKDEWQNDEVSEAFGVPKTIKKPKEKTPGVKAILVFEDSFYRSKKRLKEYKNLRPAVDLPEVISAMIDVCDSDDELMMLVTKKIIMRREKQLSELKAGLDSIKSAFTP
jgi:hypothetical protein